MEKLNIEKFNPTKVELQNISKKYLLLEIAGLDDKKGYEIVDEARKDLKEKRVEIQKTGKSLRNEAILFQKAVIKLEKELVAIIEPVEAGLKGMQDKVDLEKEKMQRMKLLPERKEKLSKISVIIDNNFLLMMDEIKFESFYNEKYTEFLLEKERIMAKEKYKLEEMQRIEEATKQARIEAGIQAKKELELSKQKAEFEKQEIIRKAELEKQAIIDEQNKKEITRIEAEELKKEQAKEEIRLEKEKQDKFEKQEKYQKFLKDNNYNENEDYLLNKENKIFLMRKVAEFKLTN